MIWTAIALVATVVGGGITVSVLQKNQTPIIKMLLAFSGGFLLSMAFTHFVPSLYENGAENVGMYILLGFLIQLLLELFSGGIEHGHVHLHPGKSFPIAVLLSLCIHSFIEGIPLGAGITVEHGDHVHGEDYSLLMGIILHQFPVAIALMTVLLSSALSLKKAWLYLILFAIMSPTGMMIGSWQKDATFDFGIIMAIVVGMFLHISTTIIFETSENHKFNVLKLSAIIGGTILALVIHSF